MSVDMEQSKAGSIMKDSLTIAIEGAECLARLVDRRGKFLYRYDADNPGPSTGYNILRHCGTIWAMTEIANRAGPLPDVAAAAQRAAEWLIGLIEGNPISEEKAQIYEPELIIRDSTRAV